MKRAYVTLTDLPGTAIDEILSHLPIRDAVRTSALSRSWRHRWKSIPSLVLTGFRSPIVVSLILLHHSSPLSLFFLDFSPSDPIHCWLSSVSLRPRDSLRSLTLSATAISSLSISSIARYFPDLTHLELTHCSCASVHSSGFPNLKHLSLQLVHSCSNLSGLISFCPSLEILVIKIADMRGHRLDIVGPKLRDLVVLKINPDCFSIKSTPLLESLLIADCFKNETGVSDLPALFGDAAASVKKVELDYWIFRAWLNTAFGDGTLALSGIPIRFHSLRKMTLRVRLTCRKQALLTFHLLRTVPNLQELEITGCSYDGKLIQLRSELWNNALKRKYIFDRLETLNMYWFEGEQAELDFIEFVLAKARILKTVLVKLSPCSRKESAMKKLLEFPRASNQAKILLTDD